MRLSYESSNSSLVMELNSSSFETLVNAVFHKSYREPEPVEIRIYVDSIQILNYPGLAKWIYHELNS